MSHPIYWLDENPALFPNPNCALNEPNGLLAAGGDLSIERLINAYSLGIFPWYNEGEPILWWSPNPRCVIKPMDFTPSKSLKKIIRKGTFDIQFDCNFRDVITQCAVIRSEGTWINQDIIEAYCELNSKGVAHSIECYENNELVGGLYGISLGGVFFGESMFSNKSNASKVAFYHLCQRLSEWGFTLIDCQVHSKHLESLGATNLTREDFHKLLNAGLSSGARWQNDPI